jgi:hypothetical protein
MKKLRNNNGSFFLIFIFFIFSPLLKAQEQKFLKNELRFSPFHFFTQSIFLEYERNFSEKFSLEVGGIGYMNRKKQNLITFSYGITSQLQLKYYYTQSDMTQPVYLRFYGDLFIDYTYYQDEYENYNAPGTVILPVKSYEIFRIPGGGVGMGMKINANKTFTMDFLLAGGMRVPDNLNDPQNANPLLFYKWGFYPKLNICIGVAF